MNRLDYRKKTLKWNRLFRTPKVQTLIDEKFEELFGELKKSSEFNKSELNLKKVELRERFYLDIMYRVEEPHTKKNIGNSIEAFNKLKENKKLSSDERAKLGVLHSDGLGLLKSIIDDVSKDKSLFFKEFQVMIKNLTEEKDKRRTFPIELMKKIKEIENKNKKVIPKPTQIDCVVLANREVHFCDESDLIYELGTPKQLAISIRDSYKAQKKTL